MDFRYYRTSARSRQPASAGTHALKGPRRHWRRRGLRGLAVLVALLVAFAVAALAAGAAAGATLVAPRPGQSFEPATPPPFERWWPGLPWRRGAEDPILSTQMD